MQQFGQQAAEDQEENGDRDSKAIIPASVQLRASVL